MWDDRDGDGVQDAGEPGLGGVTVQVYNAAGTVLLQETQTASNGLWDVVIHPTQAHLIVVSPPSNRTFTLVDRGNDTLDSDISIGGLLVNPSDCDIDLSIDVGFSMIGLVEHSPSAGAIGVPSDSDVTIWIDRPVTTQSVDFSTIVVRGDHHGPYPGTFALTDPTTIVFTAVSPFGENEILFVDLLPGPTNGGGLGFLAPRHFFFSTADRGCKLFGFVDGGQNLGAETGFGVALGDLDADGDLDAVVANSTGGSKVWLNDGGGGFSNAVVDMGNDKGYGVKLGDLNGDGTLDIILAHEGQPNRVWFNTGAGQFVDSGNMLGSYASRDVDLGDVDSDGDLDAVVANRNEKGSRVWLNDGTGIFTETGQGFGPTNTLGVRLGDLDGDGDLDFILTAFQSTNSIWTNRGDGLFFATGQEMDAALNTYEVALGDLDGDGDLDAAFANRNGGNKVWFNDGSGFFTDSGQSLGSSQSRSVELRDIDNDRDLDMFIANFNNGIDRIWINQGDGIFIERPSEFGPNSSGAAMPGDLNGDGLLDLFVATAQSQADRVWLNLGCLSVTNTVPASAVAGVPAGASIT
ncbi:MAG: FG-GAP-like repeat-containing protein, partial [Verrucomicrobiota bacterium]